MVVIDLFTPDGERPAGVVIQQVFTSLDGGASHAYLRFERARVPAWHIIGEPSSRRPRRSGSSGGGSGLDRAMAQIGSVRLALSAQAVGTALWVLDHLQDRVLHRPHRSGSPLAQKESVQLRHAELHLQVFAARSMLYRVARLVDSEGADSTKAEVLAAKIFTTETAGKVWRPNDQPA
jgi:acyl-CoA dehydrogenase